MKALAILAASGLLGAAAPLAAQANNAGDLGEVVVTAQRTSQPFYQQQRPVVGLRRQADSAVQMIQIASDSRDEAERKREIQAMVAVALDRASAAGLELVTGKFRAGSGEQDECKGPALSGRGTARYQPGADHDQSQAGRHAAGNAAAD